MSQRPILSRLILPFAGMIVLVVCVCGIVTFLAGQWAAHRQQIDELSRLARLVRNQLPADPDESALTASQTHQLKSLAEGLATRITLIDGDGKVILDTDVDASTMENHNTRPEIVQARHSGVGSSVRFSNTLKQDAVYVAQPVDADKPNAMILRLSYPRRVWARLPVPGWAIVVAATLSSALLISWLTLLLYRNWIVPVQALSEAAGKLSAGHWNTRVSINGAGELQDFSKRLNQVADRAEKQLTDLDARRSELQALVDSLPDPILLTDAEDRVVLVNRPATKLLQCSAAQALGKLLTEVLNDPTLLSLIQGAASPNVAPSDTAPHDVALTRNGQRLYYQAVATATRGGGVLLVLRNVTTMASAVQMKTDFVANASHELRTPIAAIKMAFETLQDVRGEDAQQTDKCLGIISGHITRLEEMLADLLDLSRVEDPDLKPEQKPVSVEQLFATVRSNLATMARQKGVELAFDCDAEAPTEFISDRRLLNLVLRNLVENAIKFTAAGGHVTVRFARAGFDLSLRVEDDGIGISAEHLERVFERFYQVDAARAAAVGRGTGLGLAIVKHAVHALGGVVDLQSSVGKGTTVACRFSAAETAPTEPAVFAAD